MRLIETAAYRGPHLWSRLPMIRLKVDLGPLEAYPTTKLDGFTPALTRLLPGLAGHGCSYHQPGGFLRRLEDGTWLGHVVEHVALELQTMAGTPTTRGKTRSVRGQSGVYNILFAYEDEAVGMEAGLMALRLVDSLLPEALRGLEGLPGAADGAFDFEKAMTSLKALVRKSALGPTTHSLVTEARRRDIPVTRLNDQSLIRLGWGKRQQIIRASITGQTSLIATETAGDKNLAKTLLLQGGVPAPRGVVVRTAAAAVEHARRIRGPVVVKPLDGNHGRGVSLDLTTAEEITWAFEQAVKHSRKVIVEEQYTGRDYRILVIGGQIAAVAERVPAQVIGDGRRTIEELISQVNSDPRRGVGHEKVMTRIIIDEAMHERLSREGLTVASVPEHGRVVHLRATANLSTGGGAIDRTDVIHPDNAGIARRAAAIVGLDVAGIDFITPDIARSAHEAGGGVVEVNAAPGFRMHLEPSEGRSRNVARPVIDMLFPRGSGRIPLVAITGTNGKSTTVRMVARILCRQGLRVGFTTTSGVYIGEERIHKSDASGPKSARMVLADPTVEAAVLETARGGMLREGLGFDRCDVGCVLNVTADHLGVKGVDTLEDLAAVKSIVTESVSRRGLSVLNADDPLTLRMARHARGRIAYFSMKGGHDISPFLQKHIAAGGLAATLEPSVHGGRLMLHERGRAREIITVDAIPGALGGDAWFNVANALAACLIAHGLGLSRDAIASGLAGFQSSFDDNPGRVNIHDGHGFRVILDYAHNPAGLNALGDLVRSLRPRYGRVIGCVSIPGDRRDDDIREMGALAAELLDDIVFREKPDGRGRAPGEVLELLRRGAIEAGCAEERIRCVLGEGDAIAECLNRAERGDLVIVLPTDVEGAWRQIRTFVPSGGPRRHVEPPELHA